MRDGVQKRKRREDTHDDSHVLTSRNDNVRVPRTRDDGMTHAARSIIARRRRRRHRVRTQRRRTGWFRGHIEGARTRCMRTECGGGVG
jgi:hypothetical protein